ncbi:hypothetical protein JCM11491_006014 [Sporobolomyces phaffii]
MSVSGEFIPARGFHPTLHLSIDPGRAPRRSCALIAAVSIPPAFILDRYQLAQLERDGALSGSRILAISGDVDLEAPEWSASASESAGVLVQLVDPTTSSSSPTPPQPLDATVTLDIPLHLRYQRPSHLGRAHVAIEPPPRVFWACPDDGDGDDDGPRVEPTSTTQIMPCPPTCPLFAPDVPFRSSSPLANYSSLFFLDSSSSPSSPCAPRQPPHAPPFATIVVPTAFDSHAAFVGPTTVVVVWLGFAYLAWTTYRTVLGPSSTSSPRFRTSPSRPRRAPPPSSPSSTTSTTSTTPRTTPAARNRIGTASLEKSN